MSIELTISKTVFFSKLGCGFNRAIENTYTCPHLLKNINNGFCSTTGTNHSYLFMFNFYRPQKFFQCATEARGISIITKPFIVFSYKSITSFNLHNLWRLFVNIIHNRFLVRYSYRKTFYTNAFAESQCIRNQLRAIRYINSIQFFVFVTLVMYFWT